MNGKQRVQKMMETAKSRFRGLPSAGLERRFNFKVKDKAAIGELYLYDVIGVDWFGGVGAKDVAAALDSMKECKQLNIYINSPGGDVFEATAIYNLLDRFEGKKTCYIDGLAASAASYIPMVAEKIITAHNAQWMIHNPWSMAYGEAEDFRKAAEMLDQTRDIIAKTYQRKTKQKMDDIVAWMDAETWMTADVAKERKFTDEVTGADECECECDECKNGNCEECSCDGCASCEDGECEGCGGERAAAAMSFTLLDAYKNTPPKLRARATSQRTRLAEAEAYVIRQKMKEQKPSGPARGGTATASRGGATK